MAMVFLRRRQEADSGRPLLFAWHSHAAQESWTAKVDVKASILLAIDGGALFAVLAGHADGGALRSLPCAARPLEATGIGLLILATVSAALGIFPMLGPRRPRSSDQGLIYFGHLRHQSESEVATRLQRLSQREEIEMIARQLVEMSKRNWKKHRLLQFALLFTFGGFIALCLTAIVSVSQS